MRYAMHTGSSAKSRREFRMRNETNGTLATAKRFAESEIGAAERRVEAAKESGNDEAYGRAMGDLTRWKRLLAQVRAGDEEAAEQVIEDCRRSLNASIVAANHSYDVMFNGGMDGSNSHADIAAVAHAQAAAIESLLKKREEQGRITPESEK